MSGGSRLPAWPRTSSSSARTTPSAGTRKAALLPLDYYPIDPAFNVPAVLRPAPDAPIVRIITSTGSMEDHRVLGTLEFTVKGQTLKLTAFASAANRLFVPFQDQTSGTETYGAGRYIDLVRTGSRPLPDRLQQRLQP